MTGDGRSEWEGERKRISGRKDSTGPERRQTLVSSETEGRPGWPEWHEGRVGEEEASECGRVGPGSAR